jgi:hypothetical protein
VAEVVDGFAPPSIHILKTKRMNMNINYYEI